ncbi:MAG: radical SAM protein [Desulfobacterales bacterium]|nr:radical SAM protein [Desulfobacterales bacterium]
MKILLIYPYPLYDRSQAHQEDISAVPIGMYYVAAVLRENGYDVEILNWHNIHKDPQKIVETFAEKKPDVIGFSVLNANRWGGIEIAGIARKINPKVKIVFGGVAATFLWKHFLGHFPEVDFVVVGEGENAFLNLVRLIEKGDYHDIESIKGIAFRKGKKIVKTKNAPPMKDLDDLPIPARYFDYQHLVSSRGCPGKCTFCGSPKFWGRRIRFRSPENFVEELQLLYNRGVAFFYFSDDTFTINKERAVEICRRILEKRLNIVWVAISRVDHVNEEILSWMRKAGCIQISYGVESGSEKIRDLLGKPLKADQIKRAFALTHRYGILARAYFIYGSPQETWETIHESIDLIKEIKPFICISYILEIYPGTKLYSDYQKEFKTTDDIWLKKMEGICYFESDQDLSRELILAFGQKLRDELYANMHGFVDSLDLVEEEEFYEMHADFCSRLGMTFSHGDYSNIGSIREKEKLAEKLFRKALSYSPDHRAYLGLGILEQNEKDYGEAVKILSEGVEHFPDSRELNMCLAINYMNLQEHKKALSYLLKFQDSKEASYYIAKCHEALGRSKAENGVN